jgi:hypothetical protein
MIELMKHPPSIAEFRDYGMGLTAGPDPEDLIESLRQRFGIALAYDELELIKTPGELIDLIMTKIESVQSTDCLSQDAFHLIRRAAMTSFHLPRQAIAPDAKLDDIIPSKLRRTRWKELGTNMGAAKWPDLQRSRSVVTILQILVPAAFGVACIMLPTTGVLNFFLASALAICLAFALAFLTRPVKRSFPLSCFTVSDLVGWIVAENPRLVHVQPMDWTRERVSSVVRKLIVEWAGVRDFTEDSLFYPTRMIT